MFFITIRTTKKDYIVRENSLINERHMYKSTFFVRLFTTTHAKTIYATERPYFAVSLFFRRIKFDQEKENGMQCLFLGFWKGFLKGNDHKSWCFVQL
jgi:hypothetical protein